MPGSFRHEKTTSDHRWVMSLSRQAEEGNIWGAVNTLSIKEGNTPGTMNRKVENMAEVLKRQGKEHAVNKGQPSLRNEDDEFSSLSHT